MHNKSFWVTIAASIAAVAVVAVVWAGLARKPLSDGQEPAPPLPGAIDFRIVQSVPTLPPWDAMGPGGVTVDLAESDGEYWNVGRLYHFYEFPAPEPEETLMPDWDTELALFVGTGESGTCPLGVQAVTVATDGVITVHVAPQDGPACTDDFRPRTFVLALARADVPPGPLHVMVTGPGRAPSPVVTLPEPVGEAAGLIAACEAPAAEPEPGRGDQIVHVYLLCDRPGDVRAVQAIPRVVPSEREPLEAALVELFAGPTVAERRAGLGSWFWYRTAPLLHSAELSPDGLAVVDMGNIFLYMNGASTSAGGSALLSQLNHTVFQFPDVTAVEYRIDGSCDAFFYELQSMCQLIPASGYRED